MKLGIKDLDRDERLMDEMSDCCWLDNEITGLVDFQPAFIFIPSNISFQGDENSFVIVCSNQGGIFR